MSTSSSTVLSLCFLPISFETKFGLSYQYVEVTKIDVYNYMYHIFVIFGPMGDIAYTFTEPFYILGFLSPRLICFRFQKLQNTDY
jgi:hypothetical protein